MNGDAVGGRADAHMPDVASLVDPATMRMLVESSLEGLAVFDAGGRWLYMNPAGRHILGLTAEDVASSLAFCAPTGSATTGNPAAEPTQVVSVANVRQPRGRRRRVEYVATPFSHEDRRYTAVSFRDTTELVRERQRLSAFAQAAQRIAYRGSLREILDGVAEQVVRAADLAMAQILIFDEESPVPLLSVYGAAGDIKVPADFTAHAAQVRANGGELLSARAVRTRRPVIGRRRRDMILSDPAWAPLHAFFSSFQWSDLLAIPLLIGDKALGSFVAYCRTDASPGAADVSFLQSMTDQAAIAIETARLIAASRDRAEIEERHRIARELHDTVSQQLFSVGLHGRTAQLAAEGEAEENRRVLDHSLRAVIELSENALDDMRAFVFKLHPTPLSDRNLVHVIGEHAAAVATREKLQIVVEADEEPCLLPTDAAEDAYRIVVEALQNVVKHAQAETCHITVRHQAGAGSLVLEIADDGVGVRSNGPASRTFGVVSMRERAERHGGEFSLDSRPGRGTVVRVVLPDRRGPDGDESMPHGRDNSDEVTSR